MEEGYLHPQPGVFVIVSGFVDAKGSVGITTLGRLIFREEIAVLPGSHRPVQQQSCANGSLVFDVCEVLGLCLRARTRSSA